DPPRQRPDAAARRGRRAADLSAGARPMTARRRHLALAKTQAHALPNRGGGSWEGDARALRAALKGRIEGEVRFDGGSRALYATDASNYRQVPIGVVVPRHVGDVLATVEVCR